MIGREREQARIEAAIEASREGTSTSIVLVGEPGIGKSTLLGHAREVASDMRVMTAHGVEAEHDIPFAGLVELFMPLPEQVRYLPPAQRAGLDVALALESGPPPDRFTVGAAVLGLLACIADDENGLVLVIDDAQWLDTPSLDAILFALRRLDRDGVAALIASRPDEHLDFGGGRLERILLGGLATAEAEELLERTVEEPLGDTARGALLEIAAGNPLALVETPRSLSAEQLAGREALPQPIRPSAAIERAFAARIAELAPEEQAALVVAAAAEEIALDPLVHALAIRDLDADTLTGAEAAGVLAIAGATVRFTHPLLRAVAYHRAPATERRAAHTAIAEALAEGDIGHRAWHLAEAASGPDEGVADALVAAADEARDRGALAAAGALGKRAAAATADRRRATQLAMQSTEDMIRAGHADDARELIESVVEAAAEPDLIAEAKRMRGLLLIRSGSLTLGHDLLIEAAKLIAHDDPATASRALLEATIRDRVVANYAQHRELASRARELALRADPPDDHAAALAELQLALVGVALGEGDAAADAIERHEETILTAERRLAVELNVGPVHAAVWAERYEWADRVLSRMIDTARLRSTPTEVTYPLCVAAQLELRRGNFELARVHADEALRMALDTRQLVLAAVGLGALADIDASLGDREAVDAHFARLEETLASLGVDPNRLRDRATGLLALIEGEPELAIAPLEAVEASDLAHRTAEPRILQWAANLIEARAWVGDEEGARRTLAWLEDAERRTGGAWTAGAAARGRGLLGDDAELDQHFGASAEAFDRGQASFETARSELLWGERLRRARRRADARGPLRRALTVFERVGCRPLAERARRELEATGESVARVSPERRDELTPQELRIGLRVAEGRTNPEVASELFISRKTVERHLSQIYRKLGIRSRTELARVLWPSGPPA